MDRTRGTDFRSLANAVFVIERYNETGTKAKELKNSGTLPQLEKWLGAADEVPQSQQDDIHEVFRTLLDMVTSKDPSIKEVFRTRVAPIEFIFISLLLSVLMKEKGMRMDQLKEMAAKIRDMRAYVREEHVDIRANTKVGGTLMEFVRAISSGNGWKGKENGKGSGVKRKRKEEEEEEEGEWEYVAKKPTTASEMPRKSMNSASTSTLAPPLPRARLPGSTPSKTATATPLPDRLAAIRAAKVPDDASRATAQGNITRAPAVRGAGGLLSPRSSLDSTPMGLSTPAPEGGSRDRVGERQREESSSRDAHSDKDRQQERERQRDRDAWNASGWGGRANG